MDIKLLFKKICKYFKKRNKQKCVKLFAKYNTKKEEWFQGELIKLFEKLKLKFENGKKDEESKNKPDFIINTNGKKELLEVKAFSIGKTKIGTYFRINKKEGYPNDFKTLFHNPHNHEYLIIFAHSKRDFINEWKDGAKILENEKKIKDKGIKELRFKDINSHFIISLWGRERRKKRKTL